MIRHTNDAMTADGSLDAGERRLAGQMIERASSNASYIVRVEYIHTISSTTIQTDIS